MLVCLHTTGLWRKCAAVDEVLVNLLQKKTFYLDLLARLISPIFRFHECEHSAFLVCFSEAFTKLLMTHFKKDWATSLEIITYDDKYEVMVQSYVVVTFLRHRADFNPLFSSLQPSSIYKHGPCCVQFVPECKSAPVATCSFANLVNNAVRCCVTAHTTIVPQEYLPMDLQLVSTISVISPKAMSALTMDCNIATCFVASFSPVAAPTTASLKIVKDLTAEIELLRTRVKTQTKKLEYILRASKSVLVPMPQKKLKASSESDRIIIERGMELVPALQGVLTRLTSLSVSIDQLNDLGDCGSGKSPISFDNAPRDHQERAFLRAYKMLIALPGEEQAAWNLFRSERDDAEASSHIIKSVEAVKHSVGPFALKCLRDESFEKLPIGTAKQAIVQDVIYSTVLNVFGIMAFSEVEFQEKIMKFHKDYKTDIINLCNSMAKIMAYCTNVCVEFAQIDTIRFLQKSIHQIIGPAETVESCTAMKLFAGHIPKIVESVMDRNCVFSWIVDTCKDDNPKPCPLSCKDVPKMFLA